MAEELNDTMKSIISCIDENKMFLLEAGAGSGKTYSLIETIKYIKKNCPHKKILCITYTNNAKNEITSRLSDTNNIIISTIHDFIWNYIKPFQKELRKEVNIWLQEKIEKLESEKDFEKLEKYKNADRSLEIHYRDYEALHKGIISHNKVIDLAIKFLSNPTFCTMLVNSFSYIFIDEYQDAEKKLLPILLNKINEFKKEYLVLGLFGDNMQHIFDNGIGSISYIDNNLIKISKVENYRSCPEIIKANNLLRNDGIEQVSMNKKVLKNQIAFIYNSSEDLYLKEFDFKKVKFDDFKRLFLVHKQIANEVGFFNLYNKYKEKYPRDVGNILKKADERFLKYIVEDIMINIHKYMLNDYSGIINQCFREKFNITELLEMKEFLKQIINNMDVTIKEFISLLINKKFLKNNKFNFIVESYSDTDDEDFINSVLEIKTIEFLNYFKQFSNNTMLDTMHGVKGNEFEHVIVNIEEQTPWNFYDFNRYIKNDSALKESIRNRTEKLLYVACTRAKSTLIINFIVDKTNLQINSKEIIKNKLLELFDDNMEFIEYEK